MRKVCPNKVIFFITSFLTPWQILGFEASGISTIYLCFLVMLFDFKFWYHLLNNHEFGRSTILWLFCIVLFCFYCLILSTRPESLVVNFFMPLIFSTYIYFGIKSYGVDSYVYGVTSACIFALFQSVEANFYNTQHLRVNNIISVFGKLKFGIVQPTGSIALSEFVPGWFRVSGPTPEPAFLSQMLFVSAPLFFKRPILIIFLVLGILASLSKISLFLSVFSIIIFVFWKIRFGSFAMFLLITSLGYFLAGQILVKKFESKQAFLDYHPSIYMRFLPALFYSNLSLPNQIFGVGKYGACKIADKKWHRETETLSGYIDFERQENCFMTNFSSIGSLWVDFGIVGACSLGALFTFLPGLRKKSRWDYFFRNKLSVLYFWWFICFFNIYILTFVPSSYYFLAWLFALDKYKYE